MELTEYDTYIYNDNNNNIIAKIINIIPGLYKLFDEGIVNCRDHYVRMLQAMSACKPNTLPVSTIDISIDEEGTITMSNDGNGIDIEKQSRV